MKRFILITGDEDYLREKKKNELLSELNAPSSMNFNVFTGDEIDVDELLRLAETLPFLEEYRKILLNDTGILKQSLSDDVIEALSNIPESTVIIFYEKEYDQSNALYKLIKKEGEILTFIKADSRKGKEKLSARTEIRKFVSDRIKQENMVIGADTLSYFLELTGYEMMNIDTELEKLICYKLTNVSKAEENTPENRARAEITESAATEKQGIAGPEKLEKPEKTEITRTEKSEKSEKPVVTTADINAICSRTISDRIFDMTGCILSGKRKEALSILEDLYSLKVSPMKILYVAAKQFDQVYVLKELRENRLQDMDIASQMNIQDWLLKKLSDQSRSVSKADVRRYLEMCALMEQKVKLGDMPEKLAFEILTVF